MLAIDVVGFDIPAHTFWGWVGEIAIAIPLLLITAAIAGIIASLFGSGGGRQQAQIRQYEQERAETAQRCIGELYRNAHEEIRRIARDGE